MSSRSLIQLGSLRRALVRLTVVAALAPVGAGAQTAAPPAIPATPASPTDSAIRIVLLTMGQGDQVYEMFGHNAIWVQDPSTREDVVYNWGVFDFRAPGFLGRFLLGDMRYMMVGESIQNTIATYNYRNRRIWAQELNLTAAEKRALVDFIHWNVRPENSQYQYNYYLDNCSTRVRDALDRVLGGQVREYLRGIPTGQTYRSHSLRMMQSAPLLVTGVQIALGSPTDTILNADQASFLPVQFMEHVRGLKLDGGTRPLVTREYTLAEAAREPEPEQVPALWKGLLPAGLLLGALIGGVFFGLRARRTTAVVVAVLAGLMGLVGLILTLLVTITDHVAAHRNENMFLLNPVWLIVAAAIPLLLLRGRGEKVARWSVMIGLALSACAVLIHLVGLSRQPNWDVIALILPAQLAMLAVVLRARRA